MNNARTSTTHPIRIDELQVLNGCLGLSFCPGKKDVGQLTGHVWDRDLNADILKIVEWGANIWINLMEDWDIKEVDLNPSFFKEKIESFDIQYIHFPIVDGGIPNFADEELWCKEISPFLLTQLNLGKKIFVHCRGGLGRTGIIASRILFDAQVSSDAKEIMIMVRATRSNAIENITQENWIRDFCSK
jgi:ADP-ribosyl-[dinitrogen reductase] hydrolase